ncbi:MAG: primase-like DNA-binding domain-containing protein [Planctomycetota bacterium]
MKFWVLAIARSVVPKLIESTVFASVVSIAHVAPLFLRNIIALSGIFSRLLRPTAQQKSPGLSQGNDQGNCTGEVLSSVGGAIHSPQRLEPLENNDPPDNGEGVGCKELYDTYKRFCDENGCRPMNNRTFGQQVRRVFPDVERARPGGSREYRERVYRGLVDRASQASQEIPI